MHPCVCGPHGEVLIWRWGHCPEPSWSPAPSLLAGRAHSSMQPWGTRCMRTSGLSSQLSAGLQPGHLPTPALPHFLLGKGHLGRFQLLQPGPDGLHLASASERAWLSATPRHWTRGPPRPGQPCTPSNARQHMSGTSRHSRSRQGLMNTSAHARVQCAHPGPSADVVWDPQGRAGGRAAPCHHP